jgi:anti-anti-sigma factor
MRREDDRFTNIEEVTMMQVTVDAESTELVAVIRLSGRFDAYEVPSVREWLAVQHRANITRILINLQDVSFLDSAALATLVSGMKNCRAAGGDLRVCGLQHPVRIIFELTKMDQVLAVFTSERDALAAFKA